MQITPTHAQRRLDITRFENQSLAVERALHCPSNDLLEDPFHQHLQGSQCWAGCPWRRFWQEAHRLALESELGQQQPSRLLSAFDLGKHRVVIDRRMTRSNETTAAETTTTKGRGRSRCRHALAVVPVAARRQRGRRRPRPRPRHRGRTQNLRILALGLGFLLAHALLLVRTQQVVPQSDVS